MVKFKGFFSFSYCLLFLFFLCQKKDIDELQLDLDVQKERLAALEIWRKEIK